MKKWISEPEVMKDGLIYWQYLQNIEKQLFYKISSPLIITHIDYFIHSEINIFLTYLTVTLHIFKKSNRLSGRKEGCKRKGSWGKREWGTGGD